MEATEKLTLKLQTVRLYDVDANEQKSKYDHRAAVLACCFAGSDRAYSGGLDTSVREYVVSFYLSPIPSLSFDSC